MMTSLTLYLLSVTRVRPARLWIFYLAVFLAGLEDISVIWFLVL